MANATTKTEVTKYTLELTKAEAEVVQALCGYSFAKASNNTPAKHAQNVKTALDKAGLNFWQNPVPALMDQRPYGDPGVSFKAYPAGSENS